jgi:1-acyl-sn-glycerol-3-phosphate acyltransferase
MVLFQGSFLSRSIPLWKVRVEGREKILKNQAYIIISNHHSLLDILLLNRLGSRFRWVSKTENFKVPILGPTMRMAKYIEVVRGNKESVIKMMEQSLETLSKGISIMIFPEGTRSRSQTGTVLPKKGFRFSSGHRLLVRVLDPVYPESFGSDDPEVLAVEFRKIIADALEKVSAEKLKG